MITTDLKKMLARKERELKEINARLAEASAAAEKFRADLLTLEHDINNLRYTVNNQERNAQ